MPSRGSTDADQRFAGVAELGLADQYRVHCIVSAAERAYKLKCSRCYGTKVGPRCQAKLEQ
jgi:hypothetical protein